MRRPPAVRFDLAPRRIERGKNVRERFVEKGDLFRGVLERPQNLYDALTRLEKLFK